jgi:hypothetical protein
MEFVMYINEQIFILFDGVKFRKASAENARIFLPSPRNVGGANGVPLKLKKERKYAI